MRNPAMARVALVAQGRYGEAVEPLRALYQMRSALSDAGERECGRRLLEAMLRSAPSPPVGKGAYREAADLIRELAAAADDDAERATIVDTVAACLQSEQMIANAERTRALLDELCSVPADLLGEAWTQLLERVAARLESSDRGSPGDPPP